MNHVSVPSADARFAEFFSWGSRMLKKLPALDRLIVGPNNVPDGWQHILAPASSIDSWVTFIGDIGYFNRLPIPRLYRSVGVIAVSKSAIERLQSEHETGVPALAVRLGQAVVVGALAEGQSFTPDSKDEQRLLAKAGIAHGDLQVTTGIYVPEERNIYTPNAGEVQAIGRELVTSAIRREDLTA